MAKDIRSLTSQSARASTLSTVLVYTNKQLLDEVEHDIMNYQNRGLCYLPKPKAEADNTDTTTIRLRAPVFYEQIVNEAQPN